VSNKKKKASSYRAPAQPEPRRGLLDNIFAPRPPGASPMPRLRSTVARGAATALSIVPLVAAIPIVLLALWIFLTAFGFKGPVKTLSVAFALPPVTSWFDPQITSRTFRPAIDATGAVANLVPLAAIIGAVVFHGVVSAIVATVCVERLRTGSVSTWALRRAVRVVPTTIAVGFVCLGLYIFGNLLLAVLGSLGFVVGLLGSMVVGVYLFAFAPTIAAYEDRRLTDTVARSVRAARMPGAANLWLASIYVVVSLLSILVPLPGSDIGVNPPVAAWAVVIALSVGHVVMQATLSYRYLAVATEVPEQPPPRERAARR
jgi:hypothetical protein